MVLQLLLILNDELRCGGVAAAFIAILSVIFRHLSAGSGTIHGDVIDKVLGKW